MTVKQPDHSRRLEQVHTSLTMALNERAQTLRASGRTIYNLTAGEPDLPTPAAIIEQAFEDARNGYTRYTPVAGLMEVREALSEHLSRRWGLDVPVDEVMLTAGAKQGLFNFFMALLNPGDEVLIPQPAWVSFPEQVRLAGGIPIFVPTRESDGWFPRIDVLQTLRSPRTRAVILNTPNNPSGQVITREHLASLVHWCVENHIYLVYDETYSELTYPGVCHWHPFAMDPDSREFVITVNAFSKTFRMTGWRIGWVHAPASWIQAMIVIQSHSTSNACVLSQRAVLAAISMPQTYLEEQRKMYAERAHRFMGHLQKIPNVRPIEPKGAFYVWVDLTAWLEQRGLDDMDLGLDIMEKAGVAYVPGAAFAMPGYARFSIAASIETLDAAAKALARYFEG